MAIFTSMKRLRTSFLSQWIVELGVILLQMQLGVQMSWSSPYLARLTSADFPIPLTSNEASWLASLLSLGCLLGVLPALLFIHHFGSRKSCIIALALTITSYIWMIIADSIDHLYISRLLGGAGVQIGINSFPVFLSEVKRPKYRGTAIFSAFFGSSVVSIAASFMGSRFDLSIFGLCFLVTSFVGFAIFYALPESPYVMVKNEDLGGAKMSLAWYRDSDDVSQELDEIRDYVALSQVTTLKEKLKEFNLPYTRKITFILLVLFTFVNGTGMNTLLINTEVVLKRAKFHLIQPANAVVLMDVVGTMALLLSVFVIDRCTRRYMMIVSSLGTSLAMMSLGTHCLLLDRHVDPEDLQYLPIISIFLFYASFVIGVLSIPITVFGNILPSNVKLLTVFVVGLQGSTIAFLTSKSYQPLVDLVGDSYVFYAHAAFTIMVVPFALIFLPETNSKSICDIQRDLMK